MVKSLSPAEAAQRRKGTFILSLLLAGATVVLLAAGALVTSTGSSLAVPDWPLAYGQWIPPMEGGILFEHGHRLVATTVGLLTVILLVWVLRHEPRPLVRRLAIIAMGLVVFQGLLGGITVLLQISKPISVLHALTAQLFFLTTVVMAQISAPSWETISSHRENTGKAARMGALTVLVLLVQLVLGATTRHNNAGLAIPDFPLAYGQIIPPLDSFPVAIHFAHRIGSLVVVGLAAHMASSALLRGGPFLKVPALAILLLVTAQFLLGASIIWTEKAVLITVLHLVNGALLLGATGWLTLRARVMSSNWGKS
ncbi:MAG: COX15/CtaA family protein [Deltaproteobacteria bacterium]|nr:COX15/CtaA family protein [Deltaproteobacteria bacterium]